MKGTQNTTSLLRRRLKEEIGFIVLYDKIYQATEIANIIFFSDRR
jgi:hypothetical protein